MVEMEDDRWKPLYLPTFYIPSLRPDRVPLSFIPLEDLPSCLSGLGFVMSELVSEWDLHTQETHTLPIKRLIGSPGPL